ncbi:VanZ family protein [Paenibacillus sp. MBLB4367]|uniref:VanZ family protein n=1 Tax=Paenibacillus sp. MBLB4367 TaxID=3384767 RepID=UPI00390813EA
MRKAIRWLPSVIWMAVIFLLSARTADDMDSFLPFFQWLFPAMRSFDWGHFVAYFILSITFLWAIGGARPGWLMKAAAVGLCLLYGLSDEYHQSFVPGRMPDMLDIRNDLIGAAIAMLFVSIPLVRRAYAALYRKLVSSTKY